MHKKKSVTQCSAVTLHVFQAYGRKNNLISHTDFVATYHNISCGSFILYMGFVDVKRLEKSHILSLKQIHISSCGHTSLKPVALIKDSSA